MAAALASATSTSGGVVARLSASSPIPSSAMSATMSTCHGRRDQRDWAESYPSGARETENSIDDATITFGV